MEEEANKYDVDKLVEELNRVVKLQDDKTNNENDIIKILESLVEINNKITEDGDGNIAVDDVFLTLLTHESKTVVAKAAKMIAEIAQTESGRTKCTLNNVVKELMDLLNRDDIDILTQSARALGNICYENELGVKLVQENGGLKNIFKVLEMSVSFGDAEGAQFLRHVTAGFLLNFLLDDKTIQQEALDLGFIPIACSILEIDAVENVTSAMHILLVLGGISDNGFLILDERLAEVMVKILAENTDEEVVNCVELLHGQAEYESAKTIMAKSGVCEILLKLLDTYASDCEDEDTRSSLRMACDLIVLIVTGDESMNLLYANGEGIVYQTLVEWLDVDSDEDLQLAGVLTMGNFARNESHCQLMVVQGVHKKLFKLLSKNDSTEGDVRFQHALLSAVRNLVIPKSNKPIMLAHGVIDVVYPMLKIPTFHVVFKLLGTLRIVIDGQKDAATLLGTKEDLMEKVIEWCGTEDHPGVHGEANRLVAWLVINSRDKNVVSLVIKQGGIKYLVKMITSTHSLMQNEALLSLTIMTVMYLRNSEEKLIEADVGQALKSFFKDSLPLIEIPIVENALTFASKLVKSDKLKEHLKNSNFLEGVDKEKNPAWPNSLTEKLESLTHLLSV